MKVKEPRYADLEEAKTRNCGKVWAMNLRGAKMREIFRGARSDPGAATVVIHLCLLVAPLPPVAVGVNISAAAVVPHECADHLRHMRKQPRVAGRMQSLRH